MIKTIKFFLVGGAVRNSLLNLPTTKDVDIAVEAPSYLIMRDHLHKLGLRIWQENADFVTIRGHLPAGVLSSFGGRIDATKPLNADFTLCRAEAQYRDRRHPSEVTPADILMDLARRDFTINAVAANGDGDLIDPHQGASDATERLLRCVGNAFDRFDEDPLRLLRAIRFMAKYRLSPDDELHDALNDAEITHSICTLPVERIQTEITEACRADWFATMRMIMCKYPRIAFELDQSFPRLWFVPSLRFS